MSFKPAFDHLKFVNTFTVDGERVGGDHDPSDDRRFPLLDQLYPVKDRRVLELGPLEGAHTLMLHERGAREIISIEGRADNLYKCCLIKNIYRLDRARFLLEDLEHHDLTVHGHFDLCLCLGLLYHLQNPADMLERIAAIAPRIYLWTCVAADHYPGGEPKDLTGEYAHSKQTYRYTGKDYFEDGTEHRAALRPTSFWPFEAELMRMLEDTGYTRVRVLSRAEMYDVRLGVILIYAEQ